MAVSPTTENPARHEEFVALYVRHEAAVFSFVLTMVRHSADAEDVVQRASMTMWRCFEKYQAGTNFRAWAFQIAKNEALNHLTKIKRDRHVFGEKLLEMLAERAEERSEDLDARRRALDFCIEKIAGRVSCNRGGMLREWLYDPVFRRAGGGDGQ